MLYLAFAFNVLVLAAFVFEMHQARIERQRLALLIKSESVSEFVRAETQLASPAKSDEAVEDTAIALDEATPEQVLSALSGNTPTP